MILSKKQLGITRKAKARLEQALESMRSKPDSEDWSRKAEIEALESQTAELQAQMDEFLRLNSGKIVTAKFASIEDLPHALIQARIVSGRSQTDLGRELGVKPQQIQRYEATKYMGASLARLIEVAHILKIRVMSEYGRAARTG